MVTSREQERLALAIVRDFGRAGIDVKCAKCRCVQFDQRRASPTISTWRWRAGISRCRPAMNWHSISVVMARQRRGRGTAMGIKSQAVDAMIATLLCGAGAVDFVSRRCARSIAC